MIIVYFSIYCFLGYWLESIYCFVIRKKWISSGLLNGPFIPLYGLVLVSLYYATLSSVFSSIFVCLIVELYDFIRIIK